MPNAEPEWIVDHKACPGHCQFHGMRSQFAIAQFPQDHHIGVRSQGRLDGVNKRLIARLAQSGRHCNMHSPVDVQFNRFPQWRTPISRATFP